MPSKSKSKGNTHERDVAARLSVWWGKEFRRTPNSGALRWQGTSWVYGDLLPPEDCPFAIEAKHYAEVELAEILGRQKQQPGTGLISVWWYGQTVPDAQRASRDLGRPVEPMLVWRRRRFEPASEVQLQLAGRIDDRSVANGQPPNRGRCQGLSRSEMRDDDLQPSLRASIRADSRRAVRSSAFGTCRRFRRISGITICDRPRRWH